MTIVEVSAPISTRNNPKCRACKWYGTNPAGFELSAECTYQENKIKNRHREHNSPACSWFRVAEWVR